MLTVRQTSAIVAAVVLTAALGTAGFQMAGKQIAHRAATQFSERRDKLLLRIKALEAEVASTPSLSVTWKVEPVAPAAESKASPAPEPGSRAFFDIVTFLQERPELRQLYLDSTKGGLLLDFAPFIEAARMSPDQLEQFAREMARHQQRQAEISSQRRREGWASDDARVRELRRQEDEVNARAVRELLGEVTLRQYQDFVRLTPMRGIVQELLQRTGHLESPLPAAHMDVLIRSFAQHATNAQGKFDRNALDWDAALRDARNLLTPAQFEQLQMMRQTADLRRELRATEQRLKAQNAAAVGAK